MRPTTRITPSCLLAAMAVAAAIGLPRGTTAQISSGVVPNPGQPPSWLSPWAAEPAPRPRARSVRWRASRAVRDPRYGVFGTSNVRYGFVPRHERTRGQTIAQQVPAQQVPIPAQQVPTNPSLVLEEPALTEPALTEEGELVDTPPILGPEFGYDGSLAGPCQGDCGGLGGRWFGPCAECCLFPLPMIPLENFTGWGGVQGMKNPSNLDRDGSFGFDIGLNWGAPLWVLPYSGIGMQFGVRGVFSDLSGASFTRERRDQFFLTAGLFRRTDWGFQGGVVFDYMRDDWYSGVDLNQLRGELSWVYPCRHEWGFWFTASNHSDQTVSPIDLGTDTWEPTDLYAFFYRRRFQEQIGGEGRFFAGFSQRGDGLIGADAIRPMTDNSSFEVSFTYLIPDEPRGAGGSENEGWHLFMGIVWYPPCNPLAIGCGDYYRPLFHVADNGSFMVDRSRP